MKKWLSGLATLVFTMFLLMTLIGHGSHKSFLWDSNTETDLKEYLLVLCPGTPCTVTAAGAVQTIVPPVAGPTQSISVPHNQSGYAVVYARDLSMNLSNPSLELAFDSVPPIAPRNFRLS